jgi:hypothetical protein
MDGREAKGFADQSIEAGHIEYCLRRPHPPRKECFHRRCVRSGVRLTSELSRIGTS